MEVGASPDLRLKKPIDECRTCGLTRGRGQRLPENRQHRPHGKDQDGRRQITDRAGEKAYRSDTATAAKRATAATPPTQRESRRGHHDEGREGQAAAPTHAELAVVEIAERTRGRIVTPALDAGGRHRGAR